MNPNHMHNTNRNQFVRKMKAGTPRCHNINSCLAAAILCLSMIFIHSAAYAHRPHDPIGGVVISNDFANDGTAFIIVSGRTLKATRNHGDTWHELSKGIDNVYDFSSLAISPGFDNDGLVLVSSEGDGIYRSIDHGHSWKKINKGIGNKDIRNISISPAYRISGKILAADATGNLYHLSRDGLSWELIFPHKQQILSMAFLPAPADEQILVGDVNGALFLKNASQWSQFADHPQWGPVNCIAVSPGYQTDGTFWIGTGGGGLFKTEDRGKSFHRSETGISGKNITSLIASKSSDGKTVLYATTWREALFSSEDGGRSWKKHDQNLTTDIQADAPNFMLPHFKGIAVNQATILLGGFDGLFISNNHGNNWLQAETWPIGYISMMALSPMLHNSQQTAILAYGGGAYLIPDVKSEDWVSQARSLTLAGIPGKRTDSGISDIAFSPSFVHDHTIFAATEHELIKTQNSGESWKRIKIEEPFSFRLRKKINRYLSKLGASKATRLKIVGYFPLIPGWSTYIAMSPNYENDGSVFFSTQGLGQCRSTDWGKTCSVVFDTALKITTSMAISPNFSDDGTLFIGVRGEGIYKTDDGGANFKKMGSGLPVDGELKLVISPGYHEDRTILAGTGSGLYVSRDGGSHWSLIDKGGLPQNGTILSVSISPNFQKDQTILVAIKGSGIYKSSDAASSFSMVGTNLIDNNEQLRQLVFSGAYETDNTIYGISSENVFKSRDGGNTWRVVKRPIRYEDIRDVINYSGVWETINGGNYSDSTQTRSKTAGSRAALRFFGSGLRLIGEKSPDSGSAKVFVDDRMINEVSFNSKTDHPADLIYQTTTLTRDVHQIIVEVAPSNGNSGWVAIDAIEILP